MSIAIKPGYQNPPGVTGNTKHGIFSNPALTGQEDHIHTVKNLALEKRLEEITAKLQAVKAQEAS